MYSAPGLSRVNLLDTSDLSPIASLRNYHDRYRGAIYAAYNGSQPTCLDMISRSCTPKMFIFRTRGTSDRAICQTRPGLLEHSGCTCNRRCRSCNVVTLLVCGLSGSLITHKARVGARCPYLIATNHRCVVLTIGLSINAESASASS